MKPAKHPIWGRALAECIDDCNLAGPTELILDQKPFVEEILKTVEKIGAEEDVSNEALMNILYLQRIPTVVDVLDHDPFLKGCLKMASEPKTSHGRRSVIPNASLS